MYDELQRSEYPQVRKHLAIALKNIVKLEVVAYFAEDLQKMLDKLLDDTSLLVRYHAVSLLADHFQILVDKGS